MVIQSNQNRLERRLGELSTLNRILEVLNSEADFERALETALHELVELLGLSTGWVFLTRMEPGDAHQGGFSLAGFAGLPPALDRGEQACLREAGCDCQWLFKKGRLDKGVNIVECSRLESAEGDKGGLEVHASVPILAEPGPVGILNLASPGPDPFDPETLEFLTAVGRALGLAFKRARLQEQRTREREALATLEERARLAREMHDSVAQLLFAADLSLRVAREGPNEQRETALERSALLVGSALDELRGLVELLRPADLSQGLEAALCRLAERVSGSVRVHFESPAYGIPVAWFRRAERGEELAEALYRIAQEGVHNALKHAKAKNIWIRIEKKPKLVRLRVEDDGKGLPPRFSRGLGLLSLEERAKSLQGTLRLGNRPGGGAKLEVAFPIPGKD